MMVFIISTLPWQNKMHEIMIMHVFMNVERIVETICMKNMLQEEIVFIVRVITKVCLCHFMSFENRCICNINYRLLTL